MVNILAGSPWSLSSVATLNIPDAKHQATHGLPKDDSGETMEILKQIHTY
jgi:hypothetical protein